MILNFSGKQNETYLARKILVVHIFFFLFQTVFLVKKNHFEPNKIFRFNIFLGLKFFCFWAKKLFLSEKKCSFKKVFYTQNIFSFTLKKISNKKMLSRLKKFNRIISEKWRILLYKIRTYFIKFYIIRSEFWPDIINLLFLLNIKIIYFYY